MKLILLLVIDGSRRRSQPLNETSETGLMCQLRAELEYEEKENKKQREEARRIEYERILKQLLIFEDEVITLSMLKEIKYCWEVG